MSTDGPRIPRLRRRSLPSGGDVQIVRGDDRDQETDRRQARAFRRRYPDWGRYGLSAFYAEDSTAIDDIAADQLERFPILRIYELALLHGAGFEVVPTFRTPHVTIAFAELDTGLAALRGGEYETRRNPYHEPGRRLS